VAAGNQEPVGTQERCAGMPVVAEPAHLGAAAKFLPSAGEKYGFWCGEGRAEAVDHSIRTTRFWGSPGARTSWQIRNAQGARVGERADP
jgi:hypothetical protein